MILSLLPSFDQHFGNFRFIILKAMLKKFLIGKPLMKTHTVGGLDYSLLHPMERRR
jgi:hypothetical protein